MMLVNSIIIIAFSLPSVLISILNQPIPSKLLILSCAQALYSHQLLSSQTSFYSDIY